MITHSPADPDHPYRVRFMDGSEASLTREQIAVRKTFQREGLEDAGLTPGAAFERYREFIVYRCIVGSRGYGLEVEGSDEDRRGIYLPPAVLHWSLYGVPGQIENDETQEAYWEMEKFLNLALKANPTALECLYTELVEAADPLAEELRAMRGAFLSRLVYQTYNGYVMSQFKKLEGDLRNRGEIRWKHAMHLIRLLLAGISALNEGEIRVRVADDERERLLKIRRGETSWDEVNGWRISLHEAFDRVYASTALPERPDYGAANDFLLRARRSRV